MKPILLLIFVLASCASCTKRNPDVCCENAKECAEIGTTELVQCQVGVCVGHLCVDRGGCDGPEDCVSPETCQSGVCVAAAPIDAAPPPPCSIDPQQQCRQVLAHWCTLVVHCNPDDPAAAEQCVQDVESVCASNTKLLTETNCQTCRVAFETSQCGTTQAESCLACYGLAVTPSECPN